MRQEELSLKSEEGVFKMSKASRFYRPKTNDSYLGNQRKSNRFYYYCNPWNAGELPHRRNKESPFSPFGRTVLGLFLGSAVFGNMEQAIRAYELKRRAS